MFELWSSTCETDFTKSKEGHGQSEGTGQSKSVLRRHSFLPTAAFFKTHLANTYSFGSPTDFSSMLVVNNL